MASWSRWGDEDCIRLAGLTESAAVLVHARTVAVVGQLPPMAGRLVRDGDDACFVPRFAFVEGTTYSVSIDGTVSAVLVRPRPHRPASTEVLGVFPSAVEVPRNLLRFYVWFSAPMSEGDAAGHVRLLDEVGQFIGGALLPTEHELWDPERRRLTVLLDPGRIKRGLVSHRHRGYPLSSGMSFRLEVDEGFRDARGVTLRARFEQGYKVGKDERRRLRPNDWVLTVPPSHTVEPLEVAFDRPLDHALLGRCLCAVGPDGRIVDGTSAAGPEERSWRLVPRQPWESTVHRLIVDPVLEDVAGNSVSRMFDRDLDGTDDQPSTPGIAAITFQPVPD